MANSLAAFNPEIWAKDMQIEREKFLVAAKITNRELQNGLTSGDTINKPYLNKFFAQSYTVGTDLSVATATATQDQLSINQTKAVIVAVDRVEEIQSKYNLRSTYAQRFIADLSRQVDAAVLKEYSNATSDIDDSDFGGTASQGVVVTPSNVSELFSKAGKELDNLDVMPSDRFAVVTPKVAEALRLYGGGRDSMLGDRMFANSAIGSIYGFEVYVSTNTSMTAKWTPANNPSNGDTITINGVVLTFATSTSAAGEVEIAGSTALTLDNLVTALNAPGTTTSSVFTALSYENQRKLEGIVATDGTTNVTIVLPGGGEAAVASSDSNDPWSLQATHCLFGRKGAIDLVMQASPQILMRPEPKQLADNLIAWDLYGLKTFTEGKDNLVDVLVSTA